jgi:hypothetical protein
VIASASAIMVAGVGFGAATGVMAFVPALVIVEFDGGKTTEVMASAVMMVGWLVGFEVRLVW